METMRKLIFQRIQGVSMDEVLNIEMNTKGFDEDKITDFLNVYSGKRIETNIMLICSLVGIVGVCGVNRFFIGQIGMGLLHLFTFGLCGIGWLLDLINYKKLALEKNKEIMLETATMI